MPMMRPRCSILTGGFDFSGCGDFTSCPPVERAAMSNSEPIAIQGTPCMCGSYKFRFEWRKRFAQGSPRRRTINDNDEELHACLELHALEYETRRAVAAGSRRLILLWFTRKLASKKELQIE